MANGDIDVKIRFRSFLPGSGFDSSGNARQGKTNVRGRIEATYLKGGVALTPQDVGLNTIDDLTLTCEEPFTSPDPAAGWRMAGYSRSARQFYVVQETIEVASGSAVNLTFDAFGDSGHDVELL